METKPLMICDVEIFSDTANDFVFYYRRKDDPIQCSTVVSNPDPKWLLDFASEDKPYEVYAGNRAWAQAWHVAIAKEASVIINKELQEKKIITEERARDIIEFVVSQYDASLAQAASLVPEDYFAYLFFIGDVQKAIVLKSQ